MNALVLGATGHIGNALVRELLNQGHNVTATSRRAAPATNLVDLPIRYVPGNSETPGQFDTWVAGHDVVIDAAAPYPLYLLHGHSEAERQPLQHAAKRTEALLAAIQKHQARLVYISSFTTIRPPRSEFEEWQSQIRQRLHPYFSVKDLIESRVLTAAKQGLPVVIVNPTMCLGPWDLKAREFCVIPRLLCGEMPVAIQQMVNVVDVRDVACSVLATLQAERYGEPMLIGGHNIETTALFSSICAIAGTKPPRLSLPPILSMVASYWTELVFSWMGQRSPLPSLAVILACEYGSVGTTQTQCTHGVTPRPLSQTLSDAIAWYRYLGYCS